MSKRLATLNGTMLAPGVSRNSRLYTRENIGRAVARMRDRLSDPAGLPIVMRTHHEAGDDSRLIVGRLTDVVQQPDGAATYEAVLYDTTAGRDIGALIDPKQPALKSTSIHGYWVGPVEKRQQDGSMVETADDIEIDAIDFTGSPGVTGAQIRTVAFESTGTRAAGRPELVEAAEATIVLDAVVEVADTRNPVFEKYTAAQRQSMAGKGQAMPDGSYAIASKADVRGYLRTVGPATPAPVREHIAARATALGFTAMLPAGFIDPPAAAVAETYVVVCVGDDQGPLVKVCAANVDPDLVMQAAKKAAKLAARVLDNGPDDDTDAAMNMQVGPDDGTDAATSYDIGVDDETHTEENPVAETWSISVGGNDLPADQVNEIVAEALAARSPKSTAVVADKSPAAAVAENEEVAMGDAIKAAESTATTTQPAALTEADVLRIARQAVKESGKAAAKAAKKAAKQAAKNDPTDSDTSTAESTTKAGKHALKESTTPLTAEKVAEMLAAERKKTVDETRDAVLAEYGPPSRRGHRHVGESATEPTREELWASRKDVFASVAPALFAGTEVVKAAAAG